MFFYTRKEISKACDIPTMAWSRREDEVLSFLNEYIKIEKVVRGGRYYYQSEEKLPTLVSEFQRGNETIDVKKREYGNYVNSKLGREYLPFDSYLLAKQAIEEFGWKMFYHKKAESIAVIFIEPMLKFYGERSKWRVWINAETGELLTKNHLLFLNSCFESVGMDEDRKDDLLAGLVQNEKIDLENYEKAIRFFELRYKFKIKKVYMWKKK